MGEGLWILERSIIFIFVNVQINYRTLILLNKLFLKEEHILLFLFLLLILIDFVPMILFHDYQLKIIFLIIIKIN